MANTYKQGGAAVYGSLAYDFSNTAVYPEREQYWEEERRVVIPAPPIVDDEALIDSRVRTRQTVAPLAIIGYACVAVLLVFTMMARIQLTTITDKAAGLESQLAALEVDQARLLIDYESAFNLTEIEDYASANLGMQRPRDNQVFYLNSTVPDKAVVLDGTAQGRGLADHIFDFFASLGEYFK